MIMEHTECERNKILLFERRDEELFNAKEDENIDIGNDDIISIALGIIIT